jgi:hypothetical protein
MKDDGLILDEHTTPLVIAPDTSGSRISSCSAVQSAESRERFFHPVFLVDGRYPVALDAWHEEHHQDSFSTYFQA